MKEIFLRELADIQTGPFGSQLHKEDYVENGTPIVTVEHLGNKDFSEQNLPRVSNSDKERLKKYVLKEGDIVFSRVGSVDRCSYVDKTHAGWMFSGRCLRVRPNTEIDSEYLYYYFCMDEIKEFVRNIAVGATMPSINTKLLGEVTVRFPDLVQQKKIAGVLSAIDGKIKANQKINDNFPKKTNNPNPSPIGNKFGLFLFGPPDIPPVEPFRHHLPFLFFPHLSPLPSTSFRRHVVQHLIVVTVKSPGA